MAATTFEERVQAEGVIKTVKLTLTPAQVLLLTTTPIELIAAPGVGFSIEIISAIVKVVFNTTAYTAGTLTLNTDTLTYPIMYNDAGLTQTVDVFESMFLLMNSGNKQYLENKKIVITTNSTDPTDGDSDVTIYAAYRIVTL